MSAPSGYARIAARAADELEGAPPQAILRWALDAFAPRLAVTTSLVDAVIVDMVARIAPDVPVLFVDTGYHFPETIGTRDAVAATYPVKLLTITPVISVAEQDALHGPRLHDRDPDRCCQMRKVLPLDDALERYVAWASGLRRDDAVTRRETPVVDWDARRHLVKVNPLAAWTQEDVDRYVEDNNVLVNPLVSDGYPSIGCAPCTRRIAPGEGVRAGRWAGTGKVECGIHS